MDTPDIKFDHDAPYIKKRQLGRGVTYEQHGCVFNSGFALVEVLDKKKVPGLIDAERANKKKSVARVNQRVVGRINKKKKKKKKKSLAEQGFSNSGKPDEIQKAMGENEAAKRAESLL